MQVLDLPVIAKHIMQIFLARLLMHVGDEDDPAFNRAHGYGSGGGVLVGCGAGRGAVDVHLVGSHGREECGLG